MTTSRTGGDEPRPSTGALAAVAQVAQTMTALLRERPVFFVELVRAFPGVPYRALLLAWGQVLEANTLSRTEEGHYFLPRSA